MLLQNLELGVLGTCQNRATFARGSFKSTTLPYQKTRHFHRGAQPTFRQTIMACVKNQFHSAIITQREVLSMDVRIIFWSYLRSQRVRKT